jgi:hypothetical protein
MLPKEKIFLKSVDLNVANGGWGTKRKNSK